MSGSFAFTPGGDMVITKDARTVFTTAGRLVSLLPAASDFGSIASPQTISVAFPDFSKDWLYNWRMQCHYDGGGQYTLREIGDGYITVPPQEYSNTTTLAAAPSGCNITAAKVRINRTTSPTKTWFGNTIVVKPKTNVWIPFTGSVLVEEMLGMCRAFSLYIDGSGNLVLHKQQSVSAAPGYANNSTIDSLSRTMGYGAMPAAPGGGAPITLQNAGEWSCGSQPGLTVFHDSGMTSNPPQYTSTPIIGNAPAVSGDVRRVCGNAFVGANAASVTDTTNYASTYTVDLAIKFGRAS